MSRGSCDCEICQRFSWEQKWAEPPHPQGDAYVTLADRFPDVDTESAEFEAIVWHIYVIAQGLHVDLANDKGEWLVERDEANADRSDVASTEARPHSILQTCVCANR